MAVTDASGFGSVKEPEQELWRVGIGLTAWMEADGPELHQGAFRLETIADNQLMPVLRYHQSWQVKPWQQPVRRLRQLPSR